MKFKIGDKVKIVKNTSSLEEDDGFIDKTGYISEINKSEYVNYPYKVYSKPNGRGNFISVWQEEDLELVPNKVSKVKKTTKDKCLKTLSGKHLWSSDELLLVNGFFSKCLACGMIDDRKI